LKDSTLSEALCLQEFPGGQFVSVPILILQELNCNAAHTLYGSCLVEALILQL